MPSEKMLPKCPKVIAVAREGRRYWALEELYDALVFDNSASISEITNGIFAIYSIKNRKKLLEFFRRFEYSYISYLLFIDRCIKCSDSSFGLLKEYLTSYCRRPLRVRIRIKPRGCSIISRSGVDKLLRGVGCMPYRGGEYMFALEVFKDIIAVVFGCLRNCNYDCYLVLPLELCSEG